MALNLFTIDIHLENDVVLARQKARTIAAALKFEPQDQTRIATAVSEIARNTFQYGGGGRAEFSIAEFRNENGLEKMLLVALRDKGRGIPNLDEILGGKYVSQTGMGLGVIGAKRLMDHFRIESNPRQGTTVVLGKRIPNRFSHFKPGELDKVLSSIERASEDPYEELKLQNKELLNTLQELRSRQEELAQLNRELDETNRGVVALYAELNDKADFLQRASELKSHFLSNMSHEFRTPLNSIAALSQILLDRLDGALTPEQEKQVNFIRSSAQDLTDLVNDLLDLAKVEAGKVTIRPSSFRIDGLFAALRGMLRPLLNQNSSVNLVFDDTPDMPELYTDEAKVSQILRNFISNALKFTERGEVRVSVERGHDQTVVFAVADTGIGIAPDDQERIFQEWTQIDGHRQKGVKGTGLGLPLSRKYAQLLGGNVYVKSQEGLGSTFFVAIPTNFNGESEVVYIPDMKRELNTDKYPVLVVEDNREALFVYDKYLKNTQFQLIPAKDLKEARQALREFRPAAVILDVLLQGEHSWELLQELKQDSSTRSIPVFVVTVVDNREKALALGADGFHAKPVDRNWLIQQLEAILQRLSGRQVLIIDDDEASRYIVKSILGQVDFSCLEADGGNEGLRRASERVPDLIVLDLAMPDLSGFEVLNQLKHNPRTANIPVIIHTSKILDSHDESLLSEAVAIIPKALRSRELSLARFSDAFSKAGFPAIAPFNVPPESEVKHV
jgi:signal transduction histidine kinase/DNA-binding response OmpR family regulator